MRKNVSNIIQNRQQTCISLQIDHFSKITWLQNISYKITRSWLLQNNIKIQLLVFILYGTPYIVCPVSSIVRVILQVRSLLPSTQCMSPGDVLCPLSGNEFL